MACDNITKQPMLPPSLKKVEFREIHGEGGQAQTSPVILLPETDLVIFQKQPTKVFFKKRCS